MSQAELHAVNAKAQISGAGVANMQLWRGRHVAWCETEMWKDSVTLPGRQ